MYGYKDVLSNQNIQLKYQARSLTEVWALFLPSPILEPILLPLAVPSAVAVAGAAATGAVAAITISKRKGDLKIISVIIK